MYIVYRGRTNTELGLDISDAPAASKAARKYNSKTIPGRAEAAWELQDEYVSYKLQCTFVARYVVDLAAIREWLSGSGDLIMSDESTRKRKALSCDIVGIKRAGASGDIKELTASFEVQPFAYLVVPELITLTTPGVIVNPGTIYSEPVITVTGSGDITLTVNGENITLYDVDGYITLDVPRRLAYKGSTVLLNQTSRDFLPMLCVGNNAISWAGDVTSVTIAPNWRWI